ncbi:MAG TPA: peptidylprolyl isomerase [Gemmata sp.]|nr:peptidylprolyl isomerase [Gemmata sp.]
MRFVFGTALLALCANLCAQPGPEATTVATVNGAAITLAELDAALGANLPHVPLTLSQRRALRATVLNDLIDDALLKQFLAKNAPKADHAAELDAQMKALTAALLKENRTVADYLKQTGQTEARLCESWLMNLQLADYVKEQVTEEQLKAFHAANRDHFDCAEVRLSHVMIRASRGLPATERAKAKERLQAVRAEVAAGKLDLAAAAKKHSECPTAKDGGDLGYIRRRGLPEDEPLAKAAFALKPGDLSDVIETDYGFHILAVTDRKPGTPTPLEKCILEVLEEYTDDYRMTLVKKLRAEGQVKITLP